MVMTTMYMLGLCGLAVVNSIALICFIRICKKKTPSNEGSSEKPRVDEENIHLLIEHRAPNSLNDAKDKSKIPIMSYVMVGKALANDNAKYN